jgi:hypothetical protein
MEVKAIKLVFGVVTLCRRIDKYTHYIQTHFIIFRAENRNNNVGTYPQADMALQVRRTNTDKCTQHIRPSTVLCCAVLCSSILQKAADKNKILLLTSIFNNSANSKDALILTF